MLDLRGRRVWVAGHRGMVGSALVRRLAREGCEVVVADRAELDLTDQAAVRAFALAQRPDAVFMAAAKAGGIEANRTLPADFLFSNLAIATHIVDAGFRAGVRKLVMLGSSCAYPRLAPQPMAEDALLTGPLEPTNESYAVAKIVAVKLCQAYRRQHGVDYVAAVPTNLYGPGDRFDEEAGHVIPALIRRAHEARASGAEALTVWGTGEPLREFLHVDDCADALVRVMRGYSDEAPINVGSGEELSILELARMIAGVVGFEGRIVVDPSRPDGAPRKLLDSSRLRALGWSPATPLEEGLRGAYRWFLRERAEA